MTAQTPAAKAGGLSGPLASVCAPPPPPSIKQDFLAVILRALTARPGDADSSPASPAPAQAAPAKPLPAAADAGDPTGASLLAALFSPPLPVLLQLPASVKSAANKVSTESFPAPESKPAQSVPSQDATESQKREAGKQGPVQPGPLPDAAETEPAKSAAGEKPLALQLAPEPVAPEMATLQGFQGRASVTALEQTARQESRPADSAKAPPPSGTSVAITSERMNYSSQRNEIAGRTEQKLPPPAVSAVAGADTRGAPPGREAKLPLAFSWHDTPLEQLPIIDLSAKTASPAAPAGEAVVSAAPLDRLERMICDEAVTIRQTGAQTLGVSLKVDANTQLFLQLTNRDGQVQAAVRCERGNFSPEDAQWAQLQQSLARQNVQLLPLGGAPDLNSQQSFDHQRQFSPAREDWPAAGAMEPPVQPRKQKEQNRSGRNWESWA